MWIVKIYNREYNYMEYHFDSYREATTFAKVAIEHCCAEKDDAEIKAVIKKHPSPTRIEEEFIKDEPPFEVDEDGEPEFEGDL